MAEEYKCTGPSCGCCEYLIPPGVVWEKWACGLHFVRLGGDEEINFLKCPAWRPAPCLPDKECPYTYTVR